MNIGTKIIITDTNIINDLDNANLLRKYVLLKNVYISDMVKNDEINFKTGDNKVINKFKVIEASPKQLIEISKLSKIEKKLSLYDLINFVLARDNDYLLATGDNKLKTFAEKNNVEVIRTLKIIKIMKEEKIISTEEAITGLNNLLHAETTRKPEQNIKVLIKEFERSLVSV